jgi:hypothetical protein
MILYFDFERWAEVLVEQLKSESWNFLKAWSKSVRFWLVFISVKY